MTKGKEGKTQVGPGQEWSGIPDSYSHGEERKDTNARTWVHMQTTS